jgi:hypothetical protein
MRATAKPQFSINCCLPAVATLVLLQRAAAASLLSWVAYNL